MPYPVTSSLSGATVSLFMTVNNNDWLFQAITNQLFQLTVPEAWEDNPYLDPSLIAGSVVNNLVSLNWVSNLVGQIMPFSNPNMMWNNGVIDSTPSGLLLCDGSIVSVVSYPELFSIIGAAFGGDGVTTFGLPDMTMQLQPDFTLYWYIVAFS